MILGFGQIAIIIRSVPRACPIDRIIMSPIQQQHQCSSSSSSNDNDNAMLQIFSLHTSTPSWSNYSAHLAPLLLHTGLCIQQNTFPVPVILSSRGKDLLTKPAKSGSGKWTMTMNGLTVDGWLLTAVHEVVQCFHDVTSQKHYRRRTDYFGSFLFSKVDRKFRVELP